MTEESNKSFVTNVLTLMTGTVLAQLISLLSLPILQRYFYAPEDFATFMWIVEFIAIFTSIGALRLETGIITEKQENYAIQLTLLCLRIVVLSGIIGLGIALVGTLFHPSFRVILHNPFLYFLVPIGIISAGFVQTLTAWHTRQKNFKTLAGNKLIQNSSTSISQIGTGFSKIIGSGLILGKIIGSSFAAFFLWLSFSKEKHLKSTKKDRLFLIKKNKDFILYSTPSTLLGTIINFLLIDLFFTFYGETITGEIGTAKFYLGIGFSIVSSSFAQVFFSHIAQIEDKNVLRAKYIFWLKRLIGITILINAALIVVPNAWITFVLGEKWSNLLPTIRIMSIWMSTMFVSSSLSYIYIKVNQQKILVIFDVVHLTLVVGSIYGSFILYHDYYISLIWFTVAQTAYYFCAILAAFYFINKYQSKQN